VGDHPPIQLFWATCGDFTSSTSFLTLHVTRTDQHISLSKIEELTSGELPLGDPFLANSSTIEDGNLQI
jgi:hypothetical protein